MKLLIFALIQFCSLLKMDVLASDEDCNEPLVLPDNANLTSTTARNPPTRFGPQQAFLHNTHAWCASLSNADQYLVIDIGLVKMIKSIAIQGNPNNDEFVKSFSVSYAVLEGQWLIYTEIGARRIFKGNLNGGEITEQVFKNIFAARYVRIVPQTWYNHVCARVQLFGCDATPYRGLGMMNGDIPNSAITASSNYDGYNAFNGRLYWTIRRDKQAWISKYNNKNQWLKVDLSALAFVTAVATQGRHRSTSNQWVKSYWISYSVDGTTFQEYKINQARKIFNGNLDRETVVRHILSPVIYARFVRFHPNTWNVHICMRVEVYSYGRDFPADLGIEDKEVQDSQLTASSEFNHQHATYMGRLNYQLGIPLSWSAKYMNTNQWFQFDLGHTMLVTGVVTQGRGSGDYIQYVKAYKIQYSLDNTYWLWYKEDSQVKVFSGNSDVTSYVTNMFNRDVKARSIRINPTSWQLHISMRASVIGHRKGKLGSPVFTNQKAPSYITVYKNHDVTLNCETVGDKPITVTWTHKDKVLHTNQTHLTLSNVNTTQEGFYNCNATNRRGTNNKNLYIHVKDSFDICSNFHSLYDNTRLVTSSVAYVNDDSNLNETMWYVFKSTKGFSRIPSTCVAQNHCGATAPGYMQGALPTVSEGIVKRKVCFHNNGDCCQYSVDIYVRNCYMFYVYKLKKLDSSWKARYCIEVGINENPSKMFYSSEQSKALKHHVSHRLYQVPNQYHCMTYCNLGIGCVSFNYNQALMTCELNNATGDMFAHQLAFKKHYRHYVLLT